MHDHLSMATLETKDSRLTLVDETERERTRNNGTPHPLPPSPLSPASPASPFSSYFDPNGPTPATPDPAIAPIAVINAPARPSAGPDVWSNSISASLSTLATQFAAASHALAALPQSASITRADDETESSMSTRGGVAAIMQAQARLEEELETLREQVASLGEHSRRAEKEKQKAQEGGLTIDDTVRESLETRFLGIEKKLDDLAETIRLE